RTGWHPMPYLELGEFYSEFGSFDVRITVPQGYVVAATGELQNEEEKQWLKGRSEVGSLKSEAGSKKTSVAKKPVTHKPVAHKPIAHKPVSHAKKPPVKRPVHKPVLRETDNDELLQASAQPPTTNYQPQTLKTLRYLQSNIHDFAW